MLGIEGIWKINKLGFWICEGTSFILKLHPWNMILVKYIGEICTVKFAIIAYFKVKKDDYLSN
jgi:hypothetical protein